MKDYYTYIIYTETGYFYIGVKTNGSLEDLWYKYFTSSNHIHQIVQNFGKEYFKYRIINTYENEMDAKYAEYRFIRRFIQHPKCLNRRIPSNFSLSNNNLKYKRRQKAGPNGESEYLLTNRKTSEERKKPDSSGLSSYQKAGMVLSKTLKDNPHIVEKRTIKRLEKLDAVGKNGTTLREKLSVNMAGDNNPSKRKDVRIKISKGVQNWNSNRSKSDINEATEKMMETRQKLGLNKKHSEFMLANNPASGTSWYTNGEANIRIRPGEKVPEGFTPGRRFAKKITRNKFKCPHCNKEGSGPNMKRYHFDNCKIRK